MDKHPTMLEAFEVFRTHPVVDRVERDSLIAEALVNDDAESLFMAVTPLPLADAFDTLREAMKADPDYAWGWHCNIAMPAVDAGIEHHAANVAAAKIMTHLFGVDTSANQNFDPRGDINQHAAEQERARRDILLALCDTLNCDVDDLCGRVEELVK